MKTGWIKISRKIKDWRHYKDASVFRVFIELLLSASTKEKTESGIKLQQGQIITSTEKIMEAIGVSKHTVIDALNVLINTGEIKRERIGNRIVITIINYSTYQQGAKNALPQGAEFALPQGAEFALPQRKQGAKNALPQGAKNALPIPINEDNKLSSIERRINKEGANAPYSARARENESQNNQKIGYEKFGTDGLVELKPVEHRTLVETFGEEKVRAAIEDLNDKIAAGGDDILNNAKSHFHVLRYWLRYRKDSNSTKPQQRKIDLNALKHN